MVGLTKQSVKRLLTVTYTQLREQLFKTLFHHLSKPNCWTILTGNTIKH